MYIATSALRSSSSAVRVLPKAATERGADARLDEDLACRQAERLAEGVEDTERDLLGLFRRRILHQDRELVPAETGCGVLPAQAGADALSDRGEQFVAGSMAERVVDELEVIEVGEEDGQLIDRTAGGACERVRDPVREQCPVGKSRERIVEGLVLELLLEPLTVGDVAEVQHHPTDGGVVRSVLRDHLHPAPAAVGMSHAELGGLLPPLVAGQAVQRRPHPADVLGVHVILEWTALAVDRIKAENAAHCVGLVSHPPVGGKHHHHVRRVLDERAEARLALAKIVGDRVQPLVEPHETPILDGEAARGAAKRQPQEGEQDRAGDEGDDEHVPPGVQHRGVDEACVQVDVEDSDRAAVGGAVNRYEDLDVPIRQQVGPSVSGAALADPRGGEAGEGTSEVRVDRHAFPLEARLGRVEDPPVARDDADPTNVIRRRQAHELVANRRVGAGIDVQALRVEDRIDVPAHDRFDVPLGGSDGGVAQVVRHVARDGHREQDDEQGARRHDRGPKARPPATKERPSPGTPSREAGQGVGGCHAGRVTHARARHHPPLVLRAAL